MESISVQSDSYIESEKAEFNATSTTKFFFLILEAFVCSST